jgi:hypothetical protein
MTGLGTRSKITLLVANCNKTCRRLLNSMIRLSLGDERRIAAKTVDFSTHAGLPVAILQYSLFLALPVYS